MPEVKLLRNVIHMANHPHNLPIGGRLEADTEAGMEAVVDNTILP